MTTCCGGSDCTLTQHPATRQPHVCKHCHSRYVSALAAEECCEPEWEYE